MTRKYANLLFQHGSLEAVAEEYLSDTAVLCLRKLPSHIQGDADIQHNRTSEGLQVELVMKDLNIKFFYLQDMAHIFATVEHSSHFSMKESREAPVSVTPKTFSVKTDESGVKLIGKVLTYLVTF